MTNELFARFSQLLLRRTGIALKDYKKYLVISRLSQMVGPTKPFSTYQDFFEALSNETDGLLMQSFINALTTNYSYFFRDGIHFQVLKQYLQERGSSEPYLRLWSAASSSGEEAFSMAITLANLQTPLPSDRKILATDISTKVLSMAEKAVYPLEAVLRHVSPQDQRMYFEPCEDPGRVRIKDNLQKLVDFRQLNLQGDYPFKKEMDVIFLRTVMIYFGPQEKAEVIEKMYRHLKPGGLLMVGLSESLAGIAHGFRAYKHSIFMKPRR